MDKQLERRITVGALKRQLELFEDGKELYFGGLEFYRLKDRGDVVQVEFTETVYRDDNGNVIVATQRHD